MQMARPVSNKSNFSLYRSVLWP